MGLRIYVLPIVILIQSTLKKSLYDKLDSLCDVGGDICKGKNDYGSGGIVYGLYLAPKIKYYIVLNDGTLVDEDEVEVTDSFDTNEVNEDEVNEIVEDKAGTV
jgi:hypothetical protein